MFRKTIITILLALLATARIGAWATVSAKNTKGKTTVWEQPTTEFGTDYGDGFFNLALDVTKVELKADETVVYITALRRSDYDDYWFRFADDTYLKVGDQRYTILSADGIKLNKQTLTEKNGKRDMAFHFPPLPKGTTSFDFIEGDGNRAFQIKGIKPVEERWKQLFPSYWRNEQGDWAIAFFDDCAIYDCKFWTYDQCNVNPKSGEADIVMRNGNDVLKVVVGKNKKGKRQMLIGGRNMVCSMITSRFMPDYPTKDMRAGFVDTGNKEDTITVVGWLKDMPGHLKSMKTFELCFQNILSDKQESVYADLDEQGRFSVKFPVLNSSEFFCDWRRCFVRTMLEPGKTYFMLYDFKEGRRYFMGDDCRLQNELFRFPPDWKYVRMEEVKQPSDPELQYEKFDQYLASVDSLLKAQNENLDALCEAHPTLSARFCRFRKGNTLWQQASAFGQARFNCPNFQFSDKARRYAYDNFWSKLEKPYTLYRDFSTFMHDYVDDASRARNAKFTYSFQEHYKELASNDKELALLKRWAEMTDDAIAQIEAEPTIEAKTRKSEELNAQNADLIEEVNKIIQSPRVSKIISGGLLISNVEVDMLTLDSIGADPFIKDLWLTQKALSHIDHERTSLPQNVVDTLKTMITHPLCLAMIEKENSHYVAIENREFDKLVLKSSDDLKEISEGEALLKKIVEPYKGKFVLLDIWGTWCGPCKEALSHSTEEYARLNDFDIEFLYLANGSPQASWENVIKEYNVSGPNVAHYNLPAEQQEAIERFLSVKAWPTYKLFDREGRLLDLNVDPRRLDDLARLLERMSEK